MKFAKFAAEEVGVFVDGHGFWAEELVEVCHFCTMISWGPFCMEDWFKGVQEFYSFIAVEVFIGFYRGSSVACKCSTESTVKVFAELGSDWCCCEDDVVCSFVVEFAPFRGGKDGEDIIIPVDEGFVGFVGEG